LPALRAELDALRGTLREAIAALATARQEAMAASVPDLVELAAAIAEKVLGRELATDRSVITAWAREAIAALGDAKDVTVVISSDVAALVPQSAWDDGTLGPASLQVDPSFPAMHCEVRAPSARVVTGLETRLAVVRKVLGERAP
jgi:flagellar biosynthesis/type III secretory pathway protein FliH